MPHRLKKIRSRGPALALALALGLALGLALTACTSVPPTAPVSNAPLPAPGAPAIQVNQVGFLPGSAKWAVVPAGAASDFAVVDASSGREVFRGRLGPATAWDAAQETLRLADFSTLRTPGTYRLHVEGLPDSARFTIDAHAYEALNAAALKFFYFNRASIELAPPYAGTWARPAGHPDDHVLVHASAAGPGRPAGTVIAAPKGWYDAGDYNKYVVNSGITVYTLLAAYEHFPAFFDAQRLNIPESGNALPDLLDEALWNLEWMLAMQDPADGGVYHKLTNKGFDAIVLPHQATSERYVVMKSTAAADQRLISERIGTLARQLADAWSSSPYRVGMQTASFIWGSNSGLLNQAMMLIQGYRLSGDRRQLDAAQSALDFVLGRNPLGTSMVTGFGARSPQHPHHRPSEADGIEAPVP
ncbi:MAG TPA: glycoside hydrolase family 9 protein, partial [Burkholderiaceae bacterium]